VSCVTLLALAAAPSFPTVRGMFVTSTTGSGALQTWADSNNVSGLAGADKVCQNLAAVALLPNATNYVAWLSDGSDDAYCRVAGFSGKKSANCGQGSLPDAGPWQRKDGLPFARSLSELTSLGAVLYPGYLDETGTKIPTTYLAHTGTTATGELSGADHTCTGWSSASTTSPPWTRLGGAQLGGNSWTHSALGACNTTSRLYCFEKGSGDPLLPWVEPAAIAFATSAARSGDLGSWPEAMTLTGLAAGDQICRTLAGAASLPFADGFVAWLSHSQNAISAPDRIPIDGPWARIDQVEIASNKAALSAPDPAPLLLGASIDVSELGVHVGNQALTGTLVTGAFAPGADCDGWTDDTGASSGEYGFPQQTTGRWTENPSDVDCTAFYRLYCLGDVVLVHWDHFESGDLRRWSSAP